MSFHDNINLSFAFDLALKIYEYRCNKMNEWKQEIDQNCGNQETGEEPGGLQLEVR